jgi:predicted O-methyltransferase YrrM
MDYSNFIILLSRQRSGTNALRSILESHPDIFCFNEVFNLPDKDSENALLRESNYFNFLQRYARGDVSRVFPDQHGKLFLDFLEYLRCFSSKRYIVVDVKYNTTHFLTKPWNTMTTPYLFDLFIDYQLRVFNLTRNNYLRYVLSVSKALKSNRYTVNTSDPDYADTRIWIDIPRLLKELDKCYAEDQLIAKHFSSYEQYLSYEYTDVFPMDTTGEAGTFLQCFSEWLGVSNSFTEQNEFRKQSSLPLEATIENFEEVAKALRGTKFEYCLEDEQMYRNAQWSTIRPEVPAHNNAEIQSVYQRSNGRAGAGERVLEERSTITDLEKVIGLHPDDFCDAFYAKRPDWIQGTSISHFDARFLFKSALTAGTSLAVEIGTASGFSTALLCHALNFASLSGIIDSDFQVVSYDIDPNFFADHSRQTGDAAREQLPSELMEHITFHTPAFASDLGHHYGNDEISLMFIDADHKHPWPTLDLLAALDSLRLGAEVVLHDINLPIRNPEFPVWGAKYLFDGLDLEKHVPQDDEVPNIGGIRIPEDKEQLRGQLLKILFTHEWQTDVNDDYLANLGVTHAPKL